MKRFVFLVALFSATLCANICAQNDDVKKGLFPEREDVTVNGYNEVTVFSQSATDMANGWQYDGFKLDKKNGHYAFSTEDYNGETSIQAMSKEIYLPTITKDEEIYLSLDHDVEVEYYYDYVGVDISTDGGTSYTRIYAFTGRLAENFPTGIRLNEYAGKTVRFRLSLNADNSISGSGWSIYNFSIIRGSKSDKPAMRLKAANSGNIEFRDRDIHLTNITLDTEGKGSADFYMTSDDKLIFQDLSESDISIKVNERPAGCLKYATTFERENLNVVFAIDNSGSMQQYQDKVNKTIPQLVNALVQYDPITALIRFGQNDDTGCAVVEELNNKNSFNLKTEKNLFDEIWSHNVQNGYKEEYYATLKYAASTPFKKVEGAQTVIIMLGDETEFDTNNYTDCKTGENYTNDSQTEVAEFFSQKGVQTFVIQSFQNKSEYDQIVEATNGAFYDITNEDYMPLVDKIGNTLKYKCHITFCTGKQLCGESVPISITVDGISASSNLDISPSISVERTEQTKALNKVDNQTRQTLAFNVKDECTNVESAIFRYTYGYGLNETISEEIPCFIDNGMIEVTIPAEHVIGTKITYSLTLIRSNGIQISCPDITQASDVWEFSITSDAPIISDAKVVSESLCSTKKISIKVTDVDGVEKVVLYYKNRNDKDLAYESVLLTKDDEGFYSAELEKTVSRNFCYYVEAEDIFGNKSVMGGVNDPISAGYRKEEYTHDANTSVEIDIRDDYSDGCAPLNNSGIFKLVYLCEESKDYEIMHEINVNPNDQSVYSELVPTNTNNGNLINGFSEGDNVKILFISEETPNVSYEVGNFTFSTSGNEADVCIPEDLSSIDDNLKFNVDGSYTELKSIKSGKFVYDDTLSFGKVSETTYGTVTVTNNHYVPILLNHIKIETQGGFTLETPIKNQEIGIGESFAFQLAYTPGADEVAKISVYNNSTSQNPLVFYVQGESDEKSTCSAICQSVINYDEGVFAEVITDKNLNDVCLALVRSDGDTLNSDCMVMGGPAVQGFYLSTAGMKSDHVYSLMVKVDDKVCHNAYRFNELQTADTVEVDNCKDLLKSLSVNSWGTMAEVSVENSVVNMDLHVYTPNGIKTDVGFGPQLMGGPTTHNLYLETNDLPVGSYILRVVVDNRVCSKQFVNVK